MTILTEIWNGINEQVFSWRWFLRLFRWIIYSASTIAEPCFILATVYVTINIVAHALVTWILPDRTIAILNQVSLIAFSALPELIIFSAAKVTLDHVKTAMITKRIDARIWAVCYAVPTVVFLCITVGTITSVVSLHNIDKAIEVQSTGSILVIRVLSGWFYGFIQMLYETVGKAGYAETLVQRDQNIATLNGEVTQRDSHITSLNEKVTQLQNDLTQITAKVTQTESELVEARIALASKKVTRNKSATHKKVLRQQSDTVTNKSDTLINQSATNESDMNEKRQRLKDIMQQSIMRGDRLNLKKLSVDANVSYGMVRKHANALIQEITHERNMRLLERADATV